MSYNPVQFLYQYRLLSHFDFQRDWMEWRCTDSSNEAYAPEEDMLDDEWRFEEVQPEDVVIDGDLLTPDSDSDVFEASF